MANGYSMGTSRSGRAPGTNNMRRTTGRDRSGRMRDARGRFVPSMSPGMGNNQNVIMEHSPNACTNQQIIDGCITIQMQNGPHCQCTKQRTASPVDQYYGGIY